MNVTPAYSHGGTAPRGWTAIPGTSVGAGNPIAVFHALPMPSGTLVCYNSGTAPVTFAIEAGGGALSNGQPPADGWILYPFCIRRRISQTFTLNAGDNVGFAMERMPCILPWIRTRITSIASGGNLVSYVSAMTHNPALAVVSAQNPLLMNSATEGM